jgi:sugar phosphate isomerase/epimerase
MLDLSDVELLPQTLPPFPWYLGGQLYCNLFVDHHILHFAQSMGLKICFDVSHSKLACNFLKKSFSDFVRKLSPVIGHLHVVDAAGFDGEGLQVNEGEVDFLELFDILESVGNSAGFIPEIWQGHKDFGAAFWEALDRLSIILKQHE